jgi:carbonic anhydrase
LGYGGAEIVPHHRPLIQTFHGTGQAGKSDLPIDISLANDVHLHMRLANYYKQ